MRILTTLELPTGYMIEEVTAWEGTGNGDDTRCYALSRFQPVTRGHLWWKRTKSEWVTIRKAGEWHVHPQQAAYNSLLRWAWATYRAERIR